MSGRGSEVVLAAGVPEMALHDHLCFVYERGSDARRAVRDYAVAGIGRHERVCVLTVRDGAAAGLGEELRAIGVPVDDLVDGGALIFGAAEDAYLDHGVLDPDRRLAEYADAARAAVAAGHTGLRVYAETQFLLDHPDALAVWPGYELRADLLLKQIPMTAVCAYDARRWPAGNLMLAETVHTRRSRDHQTFGLRVGGDGAMRLSGDIDLLSADDVYQLLVRTASSRPTAVLDVSAVTFFDVNGARRIGMACEAIAGRHGPTTIRGVPPLLYKIWAAATWSELFPHVILED